jgi:hypothetical protein
MDTSRSPVLPLLLDLQADYEAMQRSSLGAAEAQDGSHGQPGGSVLEAEWREAGEGGGEGAVEAGGWGGARRRQEEGQRAAARARAFAQVGPSAVFRSHASLLHRPAMRTSGRHSSACVYVNVLRRPLQAGEGMASGRHLKKLPVPPAQGGAAAAYAAASQAVRPRPAASLAAAAGPLGEGEGVAGPQPDPGARRAPLPAWLQHAMGAEPAGGSARLAQVQPAMGGGSDGGGGEWGEEDVPLSRRRRRR